MVSTIDGGIHGLELNSGTLRWTVPSGEPVVNFERPDEDMREKKPAQGSETRAGVAWDWDGRPENGRPETDVDSSGHHGNDSSRRSTDVAPLHDMPWQDEDAPREEDEFEGFIPIYSGIPGGGFLHMPEDGHWKIFERTAEDLVSQSPWYDKASRGIIVGAKATKVYALDPETGQLSWKEEEGAECQQPAGQKDTLIITRSMYSIKVRNAETGAFFWNVSISEFHAHATEHDETVASHQGVEVPLLVTSADGNEVQCFDRSSGALIWRRGLPAAAVSAHLWRRQMTLQIDLHAHDQAELVVASDSSALALASATGTVHVHKHENGMYARLHPPMRVPAHVALKMMETTATSGIQAGISAGTAAAQSSSSLSTHVAGLSEAHRRELLVRRNQEDAPVCAPKSAAYPECLVGTYDIAWPHGDMAWSSQIPMPTDQPAGAGAVLGRGGDAAASLGTAGFDPDFLGMMDYKANRREQMQLLFRLASQSPGLLVGLVIFLVLLGWLLGRGGAGKNPKVDVRFPEPRLSEASSCNSLRDLNRLIENGVPCPEQRCISEDKDSASLSTATTPGEEAGLGMVRVGDEGAVDLSTSSWGDKWAQQSIENGGKGNVSFSYSESDGDDFNTESLDVFPNLKIGSSRDRSSKGSSRISKASTVKTVKKGQDRKGRKGNAKLHIPESGLVWNNNDMKSVCAQLDANSSVGGRRARAASNVGLSRDGSRSGEDDESWAGDYSRPRSVSLGSTLSTRTKGELEDDLTAALLACGHSAPNSPKTTPANGFPASPGFPGTQWNESRYQKDFEELGRIGKGAFGSVYRVKQRLDEREYAVKKVRLEKDLKSADNQRIMREVRSFSILSDHPKIVRYYGTWQETEMPQNDAAHNSSVGEGLSEVTWGDEVSSMFGDESEVAHQVEMEPVNWLYIQMELCSTSLRQLLNANGWTVDREKIRRYMCDVSEGLSYIHSKHYIHRDMKPDNIFIVDNHGSLVAKLGDFGLSCKTQPDKTDIGAGGDRLTPLTRDGSLDSGRHGKLSFGGSEEDMDEASLAELTRACGTRMYFSPELEHSGVYNQLVDVYALGIVLFEMMHVFKTGMERIKVIEQLKTSMCTPPASEFSSLPLRYILVHSEAEGYGNTCSNRPRGSNSIDSSPSSDKPVSLRKRRPFESTDDSGSDSPLSPLPDSTAARSNSLAKTVFGKPPPIDCSTGARSPGPASPAGDQHQQRLTDEKRTEKLRATLTKIALPSEVMDLFGVFEFEVCLLLRLLSQAPDRRPSAQDMRDELFKSLPNQDVDADKGVGKDEVQKLRQELAELRELKRAQLRSTPLNVSHSAVDLRSFECHKSPT